jgi:dienelactone hydrolase
VYAPNEGDAVLHVKSLAGDRTHTIPVGSAPVFSDDSRWVGYYVNPTTAELERARRARAPGATAAAPAPPRRFEARNTTTGDTFSMPNAASFAFANGGAWLAVRGAKPVATAKHDGADLIVRDLSTGSTRNIGNVGLYAFDETGTHLAYTVDAAEKLGNGVYLLTLATGAVRPLDGAAADYAQLSWSNNGPHLAVLRGTKPEGKMHRANALLAFTNLGTAKSATAGVQGLANPLSAEHVISEYAPLRWSPDGTSVLLGAKAQEAEAKKSDDPTANVDVWHWKDPEPQSVQIVRLAQERRATSTAHFTLSSGALRVLGDEVMRSVQPTTDQKWGIGRIDTSYRGEVAWGGSRADYYRVNLATGERTLIAKSLSRTMGTSPDSRYFLYLQDKRVHAYDLESGRDVIIDNSTETRFVDVTDDHDYELPTYGVAGWSADGKHVLLNHQFDIWQLALNGSRAVNLTRGVGDREQIRFRIVRNAEGARRGAEDRGIDLAKPLLLTAYGEWTKKSGYYELAPNKAPVPLIYDDRAIGGYTVSENGARIAFTKGSFTEYPDWYVSDRRFTSPRKITDANPQMVEYAWGSKRLVDYTNSKGQKLQGTLTLPANYEPGKKYPMIVYFYEKMSQQHHSFSMPVYDDRPHISTYASNGYLVLQPDVVYEIGKPGSSALDCVTSAVKKVIELGFADPARIGLQGHSWSGYQSSFILTQTDMFRTVVTGAPPTNLMSFYGTLYRSSGTIQQGISEVGQVRMGRGVTPWTAKELYESQSPVHNVQNIKVPFMILHGTEDGAVDWMQGLELYSAARRNGKEVILLSYPGEPHHLAKKENQKDFQVRMRQFFDHHLKGTPAPRWMTDGVPQLQKGRDTP